MRKTLDNMAFLHENGCTYFKRRADLLVELFQKSFPR